MRRSVLVALAIFVVVALGGVELAHWRSRPKPPVIVNKKPLDPAGAVAAAGKDCVAACDRLRICHDAAAGADCARTCQQSWTRDKARCIQNAGCETVDEKCGLETTAISCAEACQRASECHLLATGENCEPRCSKEWDQEKRRCMLATACDEIPAVCWPAAAASPCNAYCDRLLECDYIKADNETDCVESCLAVDDPPLRDCAARVSCEMIELMCLASDYNPRCLDACDRAQRCDAMRGMTRDYCLADCMSAWDEATINCVLTNNCDEVGPVCLQQPDQICVDVCRKLAACQMETDEADCAVVCTSDLPDETRRCITEQPCDAIDQSCFGGGPDLCRQACEKAAGCGLEQDVEACRSVCQQSNDNQLVSCILSLPCEAIPQMCFGAGGAEAPAPTPEPVPPPYRSRGGLPPYYPDPDRTPFPLGPARP